MHVHITARHLALTPALTEYVQKKIDRVVRHFSSVIRAQVILCVEKHRHSAEIISHADGRQDFRALSESVDLYAAIDLVVEKFGKHVARQKDKRVRGRRSSKSALVPALTVVPMAPENVFISRVSRFTPSAMTVEEAAHEMGRQDYNFFLFLKNGQLHILYRREDKTYGLLEPRLPEETEEISR
jgi:putative sigma-54 modulation protein